jgi:hypothetical protein
MSGEELRILDGLVATAKYLKIITHPNGRFKFLLDLACYWDKVQFKIDVGL